MAAIGMWVRLDLARRGRSLAVLALLVAIAAGLIMAAVLGVAGAVLASPLFPIGSARPLEPDPGIHADWLVLLGVAAGVVLLLVLGPRGRW